MISDGKTSDSSGEEDSDEEEQNGNEEVCFSAFSYAYFSFCLHVYLRFKAPLGCAMLQRPAPAPSDLMTIKRPFLPFLSLGQCPENLSLKG